MRSVSPFPAPLASATLAGRKLKLNVGMSPLRKSSWARTKSEMAPRDLDLASHVSLLETGLCLASLIKELCDLAAPAIVCVNHRRDMVSAAKSLSTHIPDCPVGPYRGGMK